MARLYGQTAYLIIPQSDFSASQNENRGWSATQTFRIIKGDVDNPVVSSKFTIGTPLITLDPNVDAYFAYLLLTKIISSSTVVGGWTDIAVEFVGFSGATSPDDPSVDPQPTYAKRGTLRSAPLNEHPKWKDLEDSEKFALGLLLKGDAITKPDFTSVGEYDENGTFKAWEDSDGEIVLTGDALEFAKRIAQGVTTYEFGTYEYTHRWEDNEGISAAKMNRLGKIVDAPSGDPPKPGTGRDWLLTGANEEQYGSGDFRFTNELVYLLSDDEGHDSFLYD